MRELRANGPDAVGGPRRTHIHTHTHLHILSAHSHEGRGRMAKWIEMRTAEDSGPEEDNDQPMH